jgi:hypothetical protein
MLYQAHTKGYLAASPSKRKVANQAPMQVIPLVMEPQVREKRRGGEGKFKDKIGERRAKNMRKQTPSSFSTFLLFPAP